MIALWFGQGITRVKADDVAELISLLKARSDVVESLSWTTQEKRFMGERAFLLRININEMLEHAKRQSLPDLIARGKVSNESKATLSFRPIRYRVDLFHRALKLPNSKTAPPNLITTFTYDGSVYGRLGRRGDSLQSLDSGEDTQKVYGPGNPPPLAEVNEAVTEGQSVDSILSQIAARFMPGRVVLMANVLGLSGDSATVEEFANALTENKQDVTFERRSGSEWVLGLPVVEAGQTVGRVDYVFDADRSGCLIRCSGYDLRSALSIKDMIVENVRWGADFWGPASVIQMDWVTGSGTAWTISGVTLNPVIDKSTFAINPPHGSRVIDYVDEVAYTVGDGPINESRDIKD